MIVDAPRRKELTLPLRSLDDWLRADLPGALDRGELAVHYQPVIALPTGEVTSAEALLRWQHPALGAVGPAEFVPLAERTGEIHRLGSWVLRTATADAVTWPSLPSGVPRSVSVNVSAVQLARPTFSDEVLRALARSGLDPTALVIEVTETATLGDPAAAARRLELIRATGARVAIDDFGTGYSLARLHALPTDALKIDRAFVSRLVVDPVSRAVVASVIALAHSLGLRAMAEGVEEEAQLDVLRDLGCDSAQGYLWGGAVPAAQFARLLR